MIHTFEHCTRTNVLKLHGSPIIYFFSHFLLIKNLFFHHFFITSLFFSHTHKISFYHKHNTPLFANLFKFQICLLEITKVSSIVQSFIITKGKSGFYGMGLLAGVNSTTVSKSTVIFYLSLHQA